MTQRTLDGAFPSRYLTSADVEGKRFEGTISRVEYEKMADGQEKPVAFFKGMKKGCVLNKTKARFLATLTKSKKFDDWAGTTVQICGQLRGEDVPCIKFEHTAARKAAEIKEELKDDLPDSLKGAAEDEDEDDL
jgi:hypothetical protein